MTLVDLHLLKQPLSCQLAVAKLGRTSGEYNQLLTLTFYQRSCSYDLELFLIIMVCSSSKIFKITLLLPAGLYHKLWTHARKLIYNHNSLAVKCILEFEKLWLLDPDKLHASAAFPAIVEFINCTSIMLNRFFTL